LKDHLEGELTNLMKTNGMNKFFFFFVEHARIPAERRDIKSADYMNLHFMVKRFYDTSVKIIPEAKNTVPDYPK
jgi:hypothetical protein